MIDEMTALRECWADAQPPSPAAQDRARAALLARVARTTATPAATGPAAAVPAAVGSTVTGSAPSRVRDLLRSRWSWRSGIAATAAAAVVGGLVLVGGFDKDTDGSPTGPPYRVEAIELAAAYAGAQPFTAPRPDQWTYVELRIADPGQVPHAKGQPAEETSQGWTRADGRQTASIEDGALQITEEQAAVQVFPPRDYPTLAGLPTDPAQLLRWMAAQQDGVAGTQEQRDAYSFAAIATILRDNLLPPAVTATLLRALALIPGVAQSPDPIEVDGRAATVVGRVQEGWLQQEVLFDPHTHEFLGTRDIAVADHTLRPSAQDAVGTDGGGPTIHIRKGQLQSMATRIAARIVDAPGRTH